ncbi:MAG: hypothetical protein JO134_10420 [Xanthobacteraceae bacterium]|nr:hypothetical protein [Xanthobacteraceae bacterium]
MRKLVHLAIIGLVLAATTPAASAKNPYAPGQLKKQFGAVPGYPGASGYAPGHLKHRYGYVSPYAGRRGYR